MNILTSLLVILTLAAPGCSESKPAQKPEQVQNQAPNQTDDDTPLDDLGTPAPKIIGAAEHHSGLINVAAVKTLSPGSSTKVPVQGYPGSSFHLGAFTDKTAFDTFAAAAGKVAQFATIDWDTQMVVYAVLDAQTNDLSFTSWVTDDRGNASLHFEWIGIEPYYVDSTPAVLAVVSKSDVKTISFLPKDGTALGTYRLP